MSIISRMDEKMLHSQDEIPHIRVQQTLSVKDPIVHTLGLEGHVVYVVTAQLCC